MQNDISWPIVTERLTLTALSRADFREIHAYRSTPEVDNWLGTTGQTWGDFCAKVAAAVDDPDLLNITVRKTGEPDIIGDLMLARSDVWAQNKAPVASKVQGEIGYSFRPGSTGNGLATEAVRALINMGFNEFALHRIVALCFAANEPSWRLMERLGMRREQHGVEDSWHHSLGWQDGLTYALLSREWPSAPTS